MIACAAVHSHRCRAANLHRPFLGLQGILHRLELCAELWAGVFLGDRLSYEIISRGGGTQMKTSPVTQVPLHAKISLKTSGRGSAWNGKVYQEF